MSEFDFEGEEVDKKAMFLKCGICRGKDKYIEKKKWTAIVIKFPQSVLDKSAVSNELDCSLTF